MQLHSKTAQKAFLQSLSWFEESFLQVWRVGLKAQELTIILPRKKEKKQRDLTLNALTIDF
jgi:hypothetical protein